MSAPRPNPSLREGVTPAMLHPRVRSVTATTDRQGVLRHSRQDKLEIIEDEGILHEVKHFPCCLQEKYPCSCP
jgi:hypothetical protein